MLTRCWSAVAGQADRGLEVAVFLADLRAPRLDDAGELVEVVAERFERGAHLEVGVELDLFADLAPVVGELAALREAALLDARLGPVQLWLAPRAAADVLATRQAPGELGHEAIS